MDIFPSSPVVISPRFRSFNPTNSFQPSTRLKQRLPRSMSTSSIPRAPKDHVGETKQQSELSKPAWDDVKSSARIDDKDKSSIKIEPRIIMSDGGYVLEDVPCLSDYIPNLPTYPNPLQDNPAYSIVKQNFLDEDDTIAQKVVVQRESPRGTHFRRAGCRQKVYFKPEEVHACIVTCGGLCPGMNTVIREIVCGLYHMYGVTRVLGIEGGLGGFYANDTKSLTPEVVNNIHKRGGTILGTSSGRHNATKIVDSIKERGVNQVYIIGGDGTQKAAAEIYEEIKKRCLKVSVIGIPKTIDNDIPVIDKSFGFDTAVEESERAINAAHVEAESVENGIGLVKLMGRNSGFIAMYATLASRDVDCCLIPESPFYLEGPGGLFDFIEKRLNENGHMVIVMAEGAGKDIFSERIGAMEHEDLGLLLSQKIRSYFARPGKMAINLKYIDPTYMIRAVPSNASDNVCCTLLAENAVHGAMAGYTGLTVGPVNGQHAYIPFSRMTEKQNKVVITDRIWARLLSSTHQPSFLDHKDFKEIVRIYESKEEKKPQINLTNLKSEGKKPQIKLTNSKSYSISRTQLVNEEDYSVTAILKQFRKY